ncbi:hypothetical protein L1049_025235 [Liquidambar formosana]|uniref:NECAP PHear domain-containing protein n=1 Tax=Liquidambar formosana TaxID=63359 RepID=A0AAP0RWG9_LIQFO
MEKEQKVPNDQEGGDENEEAEAIELVLFQVPECYVYLIPPRKSAASYRADEWNVNKWAWEGMLKVISKGEECIIRLEDKSTGELYARAFLRNGEPHPVEPVIDSSRLIPFALKPKSTFMNYYGRLRHAFIGIGFRERPQAYDFQAALHDHMKYLNKKKTAEEMEQHYQRSSSVDYSLKEGETLVIQIKNLEEKGSQKEPKICIKPPPPPPGPLSPANTAQKSPSNLPPNFSLKGTSEDKVSDSTKEESKESGSLENQSLQDIPDDDFGDFQTAGYECVEAILHQNLMKIGGYM